MAVRISGSLGRGLDRLRTPVEVDRLAAEVERLRARAAGEVGRLADRAGDEVDRLWGRAVELGVYLPVGAYSRVKERLAALDPEAVRKLADELVGQGRRRVAPLQRRLRRAPERAAARVDKSTAPARKTARSTRRKAAAAGAATAPRTRVAAPRSARELPISGYDELTAEDIVARLSGLTQTDLARLYKYEKTHAKRSTVLEAIESRMVDLPIPTYDALTVEEIGRRLEGLDRSELETLRRYEASTKGRTTVLEKIDSLLAQK